MADPLALSGGLYQAIWDLLQKNKEEKQRQSQEDFDNFEATSKLLDTPRMDYGVLPHRPHPDMTVYADPIDYKEPGPAPTLEYKPLPADLAKYLRSGQEMGAQSYDGPDSEPDDDADDEEAVPPPGYSYVPGSRGVATVPTPMAKAVEYLSSKLPHKDYDPQVQHGLEGMDKVFRAAAMPTAMLMGRPMGPTLEQQNKSDDLQRQIDALTYQKNKGSLEELHKQLTSQGIGVRQPISFQRN